MPETGLPPEKRPGARHHRAGNQYAGAGNDRRPRRARGAPVHRLLHCQHPQPEHPRRLRCRRTSFFAWLEKHGIGELGAIRTHHVSAYIETLSRGYRAPTVKQHLAAMRMLFDWLIVGQMVEQNPAAAVRGPKHVVKKGKTPVLDGDEAESSSTASMWRRSSGYATAR